MLGILWWNGAGGGGMLTGVIQFPNGTVSDPTNPLPPSKKKKKKKKGDQSWKTVMCYVKESRFIFSFIHSWFHSFQVLGNIRCPLYIMSDKQGGLPSFLRNNFVGNSRQQLLIGLEHAGILSPEEIKEAVHLSQLFQASTPKLWRRLWYGKSSYVELILSVCDTVCFYSGQEMDPE